jgi:hypothetical protein
MLTNKDIRAIAKDVDKALRQVRKQRERMLATYVARKTALQDAATDDAEDDDKLPAQTAWAVLDATWATYDQLVATAADVSARTQAALLRWNFDPPTSGAAHGPRLDLAVGHTLAFKYVHDVSTLISVGNILEEVYLTGSSRQARARLKRLIEVGSSFAIDEAIRYTGVQSLDGLKKMLEAATGAYNALNASRRTRAEMTKWRRAVRMAQYSLSAWLEQALRLLVEWRQRQAVAAAADTPPPALRA